LKNIKSDRIRSLGSFSFHITRPALGCARNVEQIRKSSKRDPLKIQIQIQKFLIFSKPK